MNEQESFYFYAQPEMLRVGKILRDEGMKQAADHAEAINHGWSELAIEFVRAYSVIHKGEQFAGEDIRMWAESKGLLIPPHKRAWGNVILTAAKRGLLRKVGYKKTCNPLAHEAIATLWQGL